jgi:hypothetical protein
MFCEIRTTHPSTVVLARNRKAVSGTAYSISLDSQSFVQCLSNWRSRWIRKISIRDAPLCRKFSPLAYPSNYWTLRNYVVSGKRELASIVHSNNVGIIAR